MSGISSLGIGSGLDLNALVQGLVKAERAPMDNRLNRSQSRAQTQLSALGSLRSAVSNLTTAVKVLNDFSVGVKGTSSNADRVGVATSSGAAPGSYRVEVLTRASAQSLASVGFDDPQASLGAGTLTLSIADETHEMVLTAENDTLEDVRDALNDSGLPVQAVIVRDGDQHRLLLTGTETGHAGEITLSGDPSVDARLSSANMTETAAARDAEFRINGLLLTSASNRVDDVIPGVTLELLAETDSDEVTVSISPDRAGVQSKLDAVVRAYNALVDNIASAGRVNPGGNSGPLVGDATLRSVQGAIAGVFSRGIANDGAFGSLLELGFSTDANGKASLNTERLDAALADGEVDVERVLAAFAGEFGMVLKAYGDDGGTIKSRTDTINAELRRIGDRREALDRRMEQVEARLRAQFTALDAMVAEMQQTSAFLTQQLAGLANLKPRA